MQFFFFNINLLLSFLFVALCPLRNEQSKENKENKLIFVNQKKLDKKVFYLLNETGQKIDSLAFFNLTFKIDSLIKLQNNLWHFIYSVQCGSGCKIIKQILITTDKSRIRVPFDFYLWKSIDYGNWNEDDKNPTKFFANEYKLMNVNLTSHLIEEITYEGKDPDNMIAKKRLQYKIFFDKKRNLFFTDKIYLKGHFNLRFAPHFVNIKGFIKDTCCILKIRENSVVFITDRWFRYDKSSNVFVEFQ